MDELSSVLLTFLGSMLAIVLACVCIMGCCQLWHEENKSAIHSTRLSSNRTSVTSTSTPLRCMNEITVSNQTNSPTDYINNQCNSNISRRNKPPYPTNITSVPQPSIVPHLDRETISDPILSSLLPSTSRTSCTESNRSANREVTINVVVINNMPVSKEPPPPSYEEAVGR